MSDDNKKLYIHADVFKKALEKQLRNVMTTDNQYLALTERNLEQLATDFIKTQIKLMENMYEEVERSILNKSNDSEHDEKPSVGETQFKFQKSDIKKFKGPLEIKFPCVQSRIMDQYLLFSSLDHSNAEIAEKTGLCLRTVSEGTKHLHQIGLLRISRRDGKYKIRYRLNETAEADILMQLFLQNKKKQMEKRDSIEKTSDQTIEAFNYS